MEIIFAGKRYFCMEGIPPAQPRQTMQSVTDGAEPSTKPSAFKCPSDVQQLFHISSKGFKALKAFQVFDVQMPFRRSTVVQNGLTVVKGSACEFHLI
jgi:hypothetical protein